MKRFFQIILMVTLTVLAASCSRYSYETVKGDPTGARIYTLDNGLKIYTIVNKDAPRIDAHIAVKVGSKNDPQETTGLAHYFEHLMFKGTKQFGTQNYELEEPMLDEIERLFEVYRQTTDPAERKAIYHTIDSISYEASKIAIPNEYDKLMSAIGGDGTNAYTSYDVTCYTENIPSNQLENWAKIQADRFENCVLRGFHTELETIYEEYNMSATQDQRKIIAGVTGALFENHTYHTPVIGWPEHLKNPSITNIKKYHDFWYVPNNMAVCLAGDFDPDKAVKIIDKYFGGMKANPELKKMEYEPEKPIEKPLVKEVLGLESPSVTIAWRFPGANDEKAYLLDLFGQVLYNGTAGLIDLDVNQQQKSLGMAAFTWEFSDYSVFFVMAEPKKGQTLDELRDLGLAEIEKIKRGEFDEELLKAIVNNQKLNMTRQRESTRAMVSAEVDCFINEIPWADFIGRIDKVSAVTKDELVAFANEYFGDNYVQINKLQKKDPNDPRIAKPQITPIFTNRDACSDFLKEIQNSQVKPIEPVFVDYNRDLKKTEAKSHIPVLYKQNVTNGTFELDFVFETGSYADNKLPFASEYFRFLGTENLTPEQIKTAFYSLACRYDVSCTDERTYVSLSGLAENMEPALLLLEEIIATAQPNPEALQMLKANTLMERQNAKSNQRGCFSRLRDFGIYGDKNPSNNTLSNADVMRLTDAELVEKIHNLFSFQHEVLYYGPLTEAQLLDEINANHRCPEILMDVVSGNPYSYAVTEKNSVVLAPYDANQIYLTSISNVGETYDLEKVPMIRLYNDYFGGGMNAIVFQEMREARGLAYSASAGFVLPRDLDHTMYYTNFIATQNDKMMDALGAFDEIINEMPVSEAAFNLAKENMIANIRTNRVVKANVLWSYLSARKLNLTEPLDKLLFEKIPGYTLDDVVKFQQENVKGRPYTICILGREKDLDLKSLQQYGPIRRVSLEEIFGY